MPFFLNIQPHDRVTIIGGGAVALAKMEALQNVAASVHVYAEKISPLLNKFLVKHNVAFTVATYNESFIEGASLVIAATNDKLLNRRVWADAKRLGIKINVVDTPDLCDFIFPAVVQRGDVQIAISTGGISPTLARLLKRRIELLLPWNFSKLIDWVGERRIGVQKKFTDFNARRVLWSNIIDGPIPQEVLEGNYARAETLFAAAVASHPETPRGALYLVGSGPGHPDLITVKAAQVLGHADVILYDCLIPTDVLSRYARKDAEKIPVGKTRGAHQVIQQEIDRLLEEHLLANRIVVRLKGGDPGIYAHAAEEMAIAKRLNVPCQIVPGVTAALGCAATAGIPLTERGGAQAVRFMTFYEESFADADFWSSLAFSKKDTLVFYMATRHRDRVAEKLVASGFDPATPMLIIEQGTTPGHTEFEATIGTFAEQYKGFEFITPTLLIIGDVIRWREQHGWKEAPETRQSYFTDGQMKKVSAGG